MFDLVIVRAIFVLVLAVSAYALHPFQLSPWTDLTVSGSSVDGNYGRDLWFTRKHLEV